MREHKYRIWDHDFKKMLMCHEAKFVNGLMIGAKGVNWDSKVTAMQWTGLHDKNGEEIYEEDLVKFKEESLEVVFNLAYAQFLFVNPNKNKMYEYSDFNEQDLEVIGNLYENPELLEKESK